jgi:CRP-like cAMP-binding protein
VISDTFRVKLKVGEVAGEMAFFEGGSRSVDVVASQPSTLAVISFKEVDSLKKTQKTQSLHGKLTGILAHESIRRLRKQIKTMEKEAREKEGIAETDER